MKEKNTTVSRKKEHVDLCVNNQVSFRRKSSGFETIELIHNALPEINLSDVSTITTFLGKEISFPLMISSMTGGYAQAEMINSDLAEVCEILHIPMGVGSQRQAIENKEFHTTFSVVREIAPTIPITANIGGTEVAVIKNSDKIRRIIDLIRADALTVHLNPLQEVLQPEGNTNFRGVLTGIERLIKELDVPIIVKEVGAGINNVVAQKLLDVGVSVIDVAGAGGTSWAGVEILRNDNPDPLQEFWEWGIPTVDCLEMVAPLKEKYNFTLVSSGGVSNAFHIAKSIALGADIAASARPILTVLLNNGKEELLKFLSTIQDHLKRIMFVTGCATINELQKVSYKKQL